MKEQHTSKDSVFDDVRTSVNCDFFKEVRNDRRAIEGLVQTLSQDVQFSRRDMISAGISNSAVDYALRKMVGILIERVWPGSYVRNAKNPHVISNSTVNLTIDQKLVAALKVIEELKEEIKALRKN